MADTPFMRRLARLACHALAACDVVLTWPNGLAFLVQGEDEHDAPMLAHAKTLAVEILTHERPVIAEDVPPAVRATRSARFVLGGLAIRDADGRALAAMIAFAATPPAPGQALRRRLDDVAAIFDAEAARAALSGDIRQADVGGADARLIAEREAAAVLATARLADFLAISKGMIIETDRALTIVGGAGSEVAFGRSVGTLLGLNLLDAIGAASLDEPTRQRVLADIDAERSVAPVEFVAPGGQGQGVGGQGVGGQGVGGQGVDAQAGGASVDDVAWVGEAWVGERSKERWMEISAAPLLSESGTFSGYRCALHDVSERKRTEHSARMLAESDWLTGLPNRRAFQQRLERDIDDAKQKGTQAALILIDLDRFKRTNDTLGHAAGDALLRETGARLAAIHGPKDLVARIGGDEFAVLATGLDGLVAAETLAARIAARLAEPVTFEGKTLRSSASLGVSMIVPDENLDPDLSLTQADAALYAAKRRRRGSFSSFNRAMEVRPRERRRLELDLRDAIGTGQLALRYQPICDVPSGRCLGFEALLRWSPPGRGNVPPDTFIPLAEEYGLIQRIDEFVMKNAMASAARWEGGQRLAVNVSSDWFATDELADHVEAALKTSGLAPDRLEIEVTERIFIDNETNARTQIAQLKALGVRVALDDFGTGYSSLATLSALPFDKVKLASAFIHGVGHSRRAEAVARAVLQLGGALGMTVCAEGVETEDQFAFLQMHRCDEVQGHLIGHPVEEADMESVLAAWRARGYRPGVR